MKCCVAKFELGCALLPFMSGTGERQIETGREEKRGEDNYKIGSVGFEAAASIRWLALGQSAKIIFLAICAKL